MPELPDVLIYVDALNRRIRGKPLLRTQVRSPSLLRTFEPPLECLHGGAVRDVRRMGKRILLAFDADRYLAIHLMIAGRLLWRSAGAKLPGKAGLAAFGFEPGTLLLTEAGTRRRAGLWLLQGAGELKRFETGALDPLTASATAWMQAVRRENHTLKRTLTDPRLIDGLGNAYSDEILHAARLSPVALSQRLTDDEVLRLAQAARRVLTEWIDRLRAIFGDRFPDRGEITAFRTGFAAHGRYGRPCPVCGTRIQRIRYAENETNYCPRCQTGGRLLADRSLSRLLRDDWPRTIDEQEARSSR